MRALGSRGREGGKGSVRARGVAEGACAASWFSGLHEGASLVRDRGGFELPELAAARAQAVRSLARLAQGLTDPMEREDYVIAVRDAQGAVRLRLRLSYDVEGG